MIKYIVKRLAMLIPVILVTSFLIYWAMSLTGGDPALMLAGDNAQPEQIEQIREELGLNDPFLVRYANYMKGMLTGDMGQSYVTKKRCIPDLYGETSEHTCIRRRCRIYCSCSISAAWNLYGYTSEYMEGYCRYDICPVRYIHAEFLAWIDADYHIFTESEVIADRW